MEVKLKISIKGLLNYFNICEMGFINNVCKSSCCTSPKGLFVVIHPTEYDYFIKYGYKVENSLLVPVEKGKCPFYKNNLCGLHNSGFKPFSCSAAPFRLVGKNTLIIAYRYYALNCYKNHEGYKKVPSYVAFKSSLISIIGKVNYNYIDKIMNTGIIPRNKFLYMDINLGNYYKMKHIQSIKYGKTDNIKQKGQII